LSYLQQFGQCLVQTGRGLKADGYAYDSPIDFLLQHGQWYRPRSCPPDIQKGLPKCCYGNAIIAAVRYELRYVEGFACLDLGEEARVFHHAWCTNAAGQLFEVTWPESGLAYYGVEFSVERADDCTWNGDACVLWDHSREYPLLREPWSGEVWPQAWPESPRLAMIRATNPARPH
jgi:hypothetical protein